MPAAASLAAKLTQAFDVEPHLIKGGGGIFDVSVDGELVYSKHKTHRFPDADVLIAELEAKAKR